MQPNNTTLDNLPEILTEAEAASFLRCVPRTLQRARQEGRATIPFVFVGDRAMYSKTAILRVFEKAAGVQP